jgi:hypothetical protein
MSERCVKLKTFCISSSGLVEHSFVLHLLGLNNLKVGAGLGVLNSSLDPVLEPVAINRHDHVDLLEVLSARLKSLLVSVDVAVARAGRSSVDIEVDCITRVRKKIRKITQGLDLQLVVFWMIVGSSIIAAAVSSPVYYE